MKKLLLLVSLAAVVSLGAKPVKVKVAELRKTLSEHAQSEIESWTLLKDLDKRMSKLERRSPSPQYDNESKE
jgi:hypothetical protein